MATTINKAMVTMNKTTATMNKATATKHETTASTNKATATMTETTVSINVVSVMESVSQESFHYATVSSRAMLGQSLTLKHLPCTSVMKQKKGTVRLAIQ